MRSKFAAIGILIAALSVSSPAFSGPIYTIDQAVALALAQNPDIEIARKKVQLGHAAVDSKPAPDIFRP